MSGNSPVLKLYITGRTPRSERAVRNLRMIADKLLEGQVHVSVVDVLENPELAEEHRILATPTLVKESPLPFRRIIGDLSDTQLVLSSLDLAVNVLEAD